MERDRDEMLTQMLRAWAEGDNEVFEKIVPVVEEKLRWMARSHLRHERPDHTFQTTALINEAFVRLLDNAKIPWQNRAHFYGVASRIMRSILVDHARRRNAAKRGGGLKRIPVDAMADGPAAGGVKVAEILAVDEALQELEKLDSRQSLIVELRFFGGLTHKEIAALLDLSVDTIKLEWKTARLWFLARFEGR